MAKGQIYVVDTHVLIWYFIGSKRLDQKLKNRIDEVRNQGGCLLVPTIVLAEALDIAEKGRVKFDFTATLSSAMLGFCLFKNRSFDAIICKEVPGCLS